ncbi:hypothetical protein ACHAXR_004260, partial [Thalassiosira sp. AJA248-18]
MESAKNVESYRKEAKWALGNAYPRIRMEAIKAVFSIEQYHFTNAFRHLFKIEARRSDIESHHDSKQRLGKGKFAGIPPGIDIFIKQNRKQKRFQVTNEELCGEMDAINKIFSDLQLNIKPKACDWKVLSAIEQVKALVENVRQRHPEFHQYSIDHLAVENFFIAMLELQRDFVEKKLPGYIDVGFHYTSSMNISSILRCGLLSKDDRKTEKVVSSRSHGSVFGNGCYTGNNPFDFARYGDTCLMVARLQGSTARVPRLLPMEAKLGANTIIGNKIVHPVRLGQQDGWPLSGAQDEVVLKTSSQCLALIRFSKPLIYTKEGRDCIEFMKNSLQEILDVGFNREMKKSPNHQSLINPPNRHQSWLQLIQHHSLLYNAPSSLKSGVLPTSIIDPPLTCNIVNEKCVICHDALSDDRCAALTICKIHLFHYECIQNALEAKPQCPVCRKHVGAPQGKCPSGKMSVMVDPQRCSGFDVNSIVITYDIQAGTQLEYHESPGQKHGGKFTSAFLPNNPDGRNLLKRFKFAWMHGLTFTVGTSLTTGRSNQCVWASIHHKTSTTGGVERHGYPDPGYFINCNEELNGIGVPAADALDANGDVEFPQPVRTTAVSVSSIPIRNPVTHTPTNAPVQAPRPGVPAATNPNHPVALPPKPICATRSLHKPLVHTQLQVGSVATSRAPHRYPTHRVDAPIQQPVPATTATAIPTHAMLEPAQVPTAAPTILPGTHPTMASSTNVTPSTAAPTTEAPTTDAPSSSHIQLSCCTNVNQILSVPERKPITWAFQSAI